MRVKCGPERPIPAAGGVRKRPQEPATTRGNRRDQARKTPTENGWGFTIGDAKASARGLSRLQ